MAVEVTAERGIDGLGISGWMSVDDGEVGLFYGSRFPSFAEGFGGGVLFGDDDDAGGFPVEAVDEVVICLQIKADPSHEARGFVAFSGMANEAGGFVEDEELFVFVDDVQEGAKHG